MEFTVVGFRPVRISAVDKDGKPTGKAAEGSQYQLAATDANGNKITTTITVTDGKTSYAGGQKVTL